jgi:hypothetical protein
MVWHPNGVPTLDGVWKIEREAGALPPFGLSKRIFADGGWTLVGGVPAAYFRVRRHSGEGAELDYLAWPVKDELTPRADGSWAGRGLMFGREFCRFRLVRDAT